MQVKDHKLNINKLGLGATETELIWQFLFFDERTAPACKAARGWQAIDCIREGLPVAGIHAFYEQTGFNRTQLASILHISSRQLNRYTADERLSPEQSGFLYELARIFTRAVEVLGDQPTAEHWMQRANKALNEHSPLEMMDTPEGMRLVTDLLSQIEYGFYS